MSARTAPQIAIPTSSGRIAGSIAALDGFADGRVGGVGPGEAEHGPHRESDQDGNEEHPREVCPRDAQRAEHQHDGCRDREERRVEDPPAHRPEEPLAEEEGGADGHEDRDVQEERDGDPDLDRDLRDVPEDDGQLGLGQDDVGVDQAAGGGDRPLELLP